MLYGEWDIFDGQVFTEWKNNIKGYRTRLNTHVIEPFKIPKEWRRFRAFDFGYSKPFAVRFIVYIAGLLIVVIFGAYGENYGAGDLLYANF